MRDYNLRIWSWGGGSGR